MEDIIKHPLHLIGGTGLSPGKQHPSPDGQTLISKENKMLRFKITDFTSQQQIQNVLIKLWRIITQLQYDIKRGQGGDPGQPPSEVDYSILPLDIVIYEQVIVIVKKALGVMYETDYYVAKRGNNIKGSSNGEGAYLKPHVFFDRFCFDLVSLLGEYLNQLTFTDVEYIMRKVYQSCTHFTLPRPGSGQQPQVNLLRYDCVETPFTWDAMTAFDLASLTNLLNRPTSSD
jgi:hypothetical protein